MKKVTEETSAGKSEARPNGLDDLIQQGARQIVQQAIEAELAALLERYDNVKTLDGRRTVIRNGYLPEREVVTAIGPVTVKVPKVRDRSGSGVKFNSNIVPPYIRKSPRVSAALPWLYLRGVSTGDMGEALSALLGEEAKGLSPNVVSRLKAQWADEHALWNQRDLSTARWVYWWADGIHTGLRSDDSDGQCLLVIIGVKPDGTKERVAIGDGFRESKDAWCELLLDLKARGLQSGPLLAAGDGAMGLWAALAEVFPRLDTSAAGFTRLEMYSTLCPNRSMVGPKLACRRSGKPPHAKKRSRPSTALLTLMRPSIRRRRRNSQKTVMSCLPSMTFLPNTGSTCERPIPLSRPSPQFGIEQLARAIAFRVRPSLASHSS